MEEQLTTAAETTPDVNAAQAEEAATDTPTTETQQQTEPAQDTVASATQNEGISEEMAEPSAPTVPIRYNHEYKELSIDEAATWAQKGMMAESVMADLRYLAAANHQSVGETIKALKNAHDNMLRQRLSEKCGGDEEIVNSLMDLERKKYQQAVQDMTDAEAKQAAETAEEANRRIAAEFVELKKEFPEIGEFSNVPKSVIDRAAKQGISLLDSYLRFQHTESRKAKASAAQQAEATKAATGSMRGDTDAGSDPIIAAMIAGVSG